MDLSHDEKCDSIATITVKEYPPSESYSSEPPPVGIYQAYQKPKSTAVQIARIAALTVVACSVILGAFILAAAWVSASTSCHHAAHLQQGGVGDHPSFQHLVDPLQSEESKEEAKETVVPAPAQPETEQDHNDLHAPIQFKVPLTLDFDELAGSLVEKNQRSRMNCVVEKRRAEEIVDHQPKNIRLPFGVNLTTDPRYEHVSGEKMMIFCESGNDQRHVPMEMMGTPIVVPMSGPMHLPLQFAGPMHQSRAPMSMQQQQQQQQQEQEQHQHHQQILHHLLQQQQQEHQQQQQQHHQQQEQQQLPTILHTTIHVAEERQVPIEGRQSRQFHHPIPIPIHVTEERVERIEGRQGRAFLHPVQIPVQMSEERVERVEGRQGRAFLHPVQIPVQVTEEQIEARQGRAFLHPVQIPVQVTEEQHEGRQGRAFPRPVQITEARVFQHPMEAEHARVYRQPEPRMSEESRGFPRLPVHVQPPHMVQQQMNIEQSRPHYVQPRSVRSVDNVFLHKREKRVRRCACDCAC